MNNNHSKLNSHSVSSRLNCFKSFLPALIIWFTMQPTWAQDDFSEFDMDLGVTAESSDSSIDIQSELDNSFLFDDFDTTAESSNQSHDEYSDDMSDMAESFDFEDFDEDSAVAADNENPQDMNTDYWAADSFEDKQNSYQASGQVIYEKQTDLTASYKERRPKIGILFSVNYESFQPIDYYSLIHNKYFDELLGSKSFKVAGAEFGLKYNFTLGSIGLLLGYGMGSLNDDAANVSDMKVQIQKISMIYTMDNLFDEPYVAPFAQVGIHRFDWLERGISSGIETEESTMTGMTYHFKAGLSFQLNWIEKSIDPNSHVEALRSSGLQNTYIDVFYSHYAKPTTVAEVSGAEGDPNLSSSEIGVGLKMEF